MKNLFEPQQFTTQDERDRMLWTDRDMYTVFVLGLLSGIILTALAGV